MLGFNEDPAPAFVVDAPTTGFDAVVANLGGAALFAPPPHGALDLHRLLLQGLPGATLTHLVDNLLVRHDPAALEAATGVGLRTLQRRKVAPDKALSPEQSGRTWRFAEVLAKATAVFGSRLEAELWLDRPAAALDRNRPIDLLATDTGARLVEDHLERLEWGVYT